MRTVWCLLLLSAFGSVGCQSVAPERTEFARGLRFRYQVPAGEHFFEVRSVERAPRIRKFEVEAFEDLNRDGVRQPDEASVSYTQTMARPRNFVMMKRTGQGHVWEAAVYRAMVTTEAGVVSHSWVAADDAAR